MQDVEAAHRVTALSQFVMDKPKLIPGRMWVSKTVKGWMQEQIQRNGTFLVLGNNIYGGLRN